MLGACRPAPNAVGESGRNPHPVHLIRPAVRPLSAVALLGRTIFFDTALSASRRMSCASCHDPAHAYGPPDDRPVRLGGPTLHDQGRRAVPSLRYLDRVPPFAIGPNPLEAEDARRGPAAPPASAAGATVPRGGLFWDGRASTLQQQAEAPLFDPLEMANRDTAAVVAALRARYGKRLEQLFGSGAVADPIRLLDEAMFAVARFEIEDSSFHPYSSKYDAYLEGKAVLTAAERRGLAVFEDSSKGNCAGCHLDRPGPDGTPPAFTDYEYEALGVPRNDSIVSSRDPGFHDLGLCGPIRADLAAVPGLCGLFRTPSLRNAASRGVFFHNGVYHSLEQVVDFYTFRDIAPERVYPLDSAGRPDRFGDLAARYRSNVDTSDPPLDRHAGAPPGMTARDRRDLVAFLRTLSDGYSARP